MSNAHEHCVLATLAVMEGRDVPRCTSRRHLLGQAGEPLLELLAVVLQFGRPDGQDAREFGGSTVGGGRLLARA